MSKVTITIMLQPEVIAVLDEIKEKEKITKTAQIELALDEYFKKKGYEVEEE